MTSSLLKKDLLGDEVQESSGSSDENHPIVACRNDRVMVGEKESGLAFAEVAFQLAPGSIELRLVIAEVYAIAVDLFQVTPDFLAIFEDLSFARAVAQITPELHAIFLQLDVVLAQLGPAVAYFFPRPAHVFEVLPYLRFIMMAAIIVASISMREARIGMPIITPVVLVEFFSSALFPPLVFAVIFMMFVVFLVRQSRQ